MQSEKIQIPMPNGVAEAVLVRSDTGEHPGVLLYPDAFGLRPAYEDLAERVATWGYTVLVPNYFYRSGTAEALAPTVDLTTPDWAAAVGTMNIRERIASVSAADTIDDATVFIDALREAPGVSDGDVATVGYCFGGIQAIRAAQSRADVVAAVGAFHTGNLVNDSPESVHRHFGKARAEFYFGHADQDPTATAETIAVVEAALAEAGRTYTSELYPDAGHGYAVPDLFPYSREAAERHYHELRALLVRTIPSSDTH